MITIYTGPMFSGKSTRLFQEYNKFYNKDSLLVLKPEKDTRTPKTITCRVSSTDIDAISINDLADIKDIINSDKYKNNKVVFIDEAQFLTGDVSILSELSINGYDFYISGLNQTSEQKPFGIMPDLMAVADNIELIKAKCKICNKEAGYTYCITPKENDIMVGSNQYISICRDCLKNKSYQNFTFK